jgi:hypothetical protein
MQKAQQTCHLCFPPNPHHHTILSESPNFYLAVTHRKDISIGYAHLIPKSHIRNTLSMDDSSFEEARNYFKCLIRFFERQGRACIFAETALCPTVQQGQLAQRKHAFVEIIPVPVGSFNTLPAYFRNLFNQQGVGSTSGGGFGDDDGGGEWDAHRVIDTSGSVPSRTNKHQNTQLQLQLQARPKTFRTGLVPTVPYVHVWMNPTGGIGHVVHDPPAWREFYVRQVIAGVMENEARRRYDNKKRSGPGNAGEDEGADGRGDGDTNLDAHLLDPSTWRRPEPCPDWEVKHKMEWWKRNEWDQFDWVQHALK